MLDKQGNPNGDQIAEMVEENQRAMKINIETIEQNARAKLLIELGNEAEKNMNDWKIKGDPDSPMTKNRIAFWDEVRFWVKRKLDGKPIETRQTY